MTAKAMAEFAKDFPSIVRPLLTERDEFMVRSAGKLGGPQLGLV